MKDQLKTLGLSYDWTTEISTSKKELLQVESMVI